MPFLEAAAVAGQVDRTPDEDELRALLPIVRERLPTLAAIVDLVGFLWVDDLTVDAGGSSSPSAGTRRPPRRA